MLSRYIITLSENFYYIIGNLSFITLSVDFYNINGNLIYYIISKFMLHYWDVLHYRLIFITLSGCITLSGVITLYVVTSVYREHRKTQNQPN